MRYIAVAVLALAGCATDTGIIQTGPDTYMVGGKAIAVGGSGHDAAAEAYKQAQAFCAEQKKTLETVSVVSRDGGFARFPNAKVEFRCVAK